MPLELDSSRRLGPLSSSITRYGCLPGVDVEVEEGDDVGVAQLRTGTAFAQEPLAQLRRRVERRVHHLDGDLVAELQPAGAVDLTHPAWQTERADDFVAVVE